MADLYNLTGMNATTNFVENVVIINDAVNGLLGISLLIIFGFVILIGLLQRNTPAVAFGTSSGLLFVIALLFFSMELIGIATLGIVGALFILGILLLFLKSGD